MKLSVAQKNLLTHLVHQKQMIVSYYPPAKKLVQFGLAEWDGTMFLRITTAGLKELGYCPHRVANDSYCAQCEGGPLP